jgi:dihydrofolate reductase
MKIFIIAATSADGFIAKDSTHSAFWTSKEDKARFVKLTKEAGVVVMSSVTFATLPRPLKERRNIVYTRTPEKFAGDPKYEGVELTSENPADLINRLTAEGIQSVAICGGSQIYTLFMKTGLVDTIYLTIEPILFGKGITLFNEDIQRQLQLVAAEGTASGSLLLEYKVVFQHHTATK